MLDTADAPVDLETLRHRLIAAPNTFAFISLISATNPDLVSEERIQWVALAFAASHLYNYSTSSPGCAVRKGAAAQLPSLVRASREAAHQNQTYSRRCACAVAAMISKTKGSSVFRTSSGCNLIGCGDMRRDWTRVALVIALLAHASRIAANASQDESDLTLPLQKRLPGLRSFRSHCSPRTVRATLSETPPRRNEISHRLSTDASLSVRSIPPPSSEVLLSLISTAPWTASRTAHSVPFSECSPSLHRYALRVP